jgi:very-short-patch-repair endonuclease
MYSCEKCKKDHDGSYGSGRFCSEKCSKQRIISEKEKENLSKKLKGKHIKRIKTIICDKCHNEIRSCNFKKHFITCDGTGPKKFKKIEICPYCNGNIKNVHGGNHIKWCIKNPNRKFSKRIKNKGPYWEGKHHTEESKEKIRKSRIKYLKNNYEKTPWNKKKFTYGENFLYQLFLDNNIFKKYLIVNEYCEYPYFIDFAFVNEKVALEYDGKVHFEFGDKRYNHDIKRDLYLNSMGWRMYRIPYYDLKNFKLEDLINFIGNSKKNQNDDKITYMLKYKEYKEKYILKELEKLKIKELKISEKSEYIEKIKEILLSSNINFNKFGWVNYASILIGCKHQLVNRWMKKNMLAFYNEKCFKKKNGLIV